MMFSGFTPRGTSPAPWACESADPIARPIDALRREARAFVYALGAAWTADELEDDVHADPLVVPMS